MKDYIIYKQTFFMKEYLPRQSGERERERERGGKRDREICIKR